MRRTITGTSPTHIAFDTPFPNNCLGIIAQLSNNTSFDVTIDCSNYNKDGFDTRLSITGGGAITYYAIGY